MSELLAKVMREKRLYTKNEKGRYEEYQIPDMDVSDTFLEGLTESMFLYLLTASMTFQKVFGWLQGGGQAERL